MTMANVIGCYFTGTSIEQVPWHICSVFEDVDDNYWIMEKLYKDVAKDFLPTRTVKVKTNSLPWVDGIICKLMNQRYRKLKKAQRMKDPKDREEYIKLRNKVNIELRKAESLYWKRLLEEKENGSKDFWKIVKKMTGRENKVKRIGPIQNEMEELIYDDTEKAETMNRFFSSVGKQLASKFPTDPTTETELPIYIKETSKIEDIPLDNSLFQKKFRKINICKSHGHDNITAKEMKMVGDEFHTAIGMISSISFESKTYPSQWKVGKVQTVHKKGKKDSCGNYRPLSMLSIPSKITVSGQNPPGQNPPGQNPPDKIPLDKIPPRTKSPQDKIPLDKIPPVYFIDSKPLVETRQENKSDLPFSISALSSATFYQTFIKS